MKLFGTLDSPYVRRVAVSLMLYDIPFESQPLSVFSTFEEFSRINPVVKAPTLILDDGTLLMDSTLILNYFESFSDKQHKLLPEQPEKLAEDLAILGLILAACEKAVQHIYEHKLRPTEKQHQPWIDRVTAQLLVACREWNTALENRQMGERADQVTVTSTVVWSFIQFMIPNVVHAPDFKKIQDASQYYESHPVFKKFPCC